MLFAAFCFGIDVVKRLIFPLGILVFMVPAPSVVERSLGLYLKGISSKLGGAMIGFFDIPVNVSGNIIDLGVTQLQVVDACSGMRYIFALLALGTIYAYFFEKAVWKQVVCIAATIPISILINILRIGMTGILTARYGVGMAEGFFHDFSGWAIFIVAFAFLFLLGRILAFFPPKNYAGKTFDAADKALPAGKHGSVNKAFLTSVVLLLIVGALSMSTMALPAIKIRGGIEKFPLEFAGWHGQAEVVDPETVIRSGAEESFSGFYTKNDHDAVSLYVGYRSTAFLSNENFFHSPNVCLPSSGWRTIEESTHVVAAVPSFGNIKVTKMVMDYMGKKSLVYFWFQTKDKATDDKSVNRFHLAMHAIKRDNTHDLFIRPITALQPGERIEDAEKRLDQFVREMMAELLRFLKDAQYEKA
jgi:exosortase D (VPLPA-CTERM-specific)